MANMGTLAARAMASAITHQESWRHQHHEVKECWRLEDHLGRCNSILPLLLDVLEYWNSDQRFSIATTEVDEKEFEEAIRGCLRACNSVLGWIEHVEGAGYPVEGSDEFRSRRAELESKIQEIERIARIETRMGYRGVLVEAGAAESLKKTLDSSSDSNPKPTFRLNQVPRPPR